MIDLGLELEKDLMRSFKTKEVEISGSLVLKTRDNIDLYPLIHDGENPRSWCRWTRKSATLGKEGREIECP